MSTNADPNANRKAGEPFRYRPGRALEAGEDLMLRILMCGSKGLTHSETAVLLGCSRDHLERFWKEHEDHKQAYLDGKEMRRVKLRELGDMHARLDPGTWRFLAKNELGLSDDPSKAKLDETSAKAIRARMLPEEVRQRILELTPKLIGETVSRETTTQDRPVAKPAGARAAASGQVLAPGQALERLQARLTELEASVVRKHPRKDGQPHTDRTRAPPVDAAPNSRQDNRPAHAPPRLPGRLGSR